MTQDTVVTRLAARLLEAEKIIQAAREVCSADTAYHHQNTTNANNAGLYAQWDRAIVALDTALTAYDAVGKVPHVS